MAKAHWIQESGIDEHRGALHRQLGVPMGHPIPADLLEKAMESGGKLGKRARMAGTLKKISRH